MNNNYIKFTEVDKLILKSYETLADGLGLYLNEGYEIVLHSLENLHHSAVKVINGHYSGRAKGAPITDLALKMLAEIEKSKEHKPISYFNKSKSGEIMKSCTIPISGENDRIIGLLCINFYTETPFSIIFQNFTPPEEMYQTISPPAETFTDNIDELIESALNEAKELVYQNHEIPSVNQNKEIIFLLYQKGIFNLKDAVIKTAKLLHISKNTVYMHIRNFSKDD